MSFFSTAEVPGSDGDHNNPNSDEFNWLKSQNAAAATKCRLKASSVSEKKPAYSKHMAIKPHNIEDFSGNLFDRVIGTVQIANLMDAKQRFDFAHFHPALAQ